MQDQRILLPQKISQAQTPEERQLVLDEFFQLCDQQRLQVNKMYQDQKDQPKKRRTTSKGSPMKSPVKKSKNKENDENSSPVKASSFSSPTKKSTQDVSPSKERRMSQQRRQREQ